LGWAAFGAVTSIVTGVFGKKSNPILTYIHIAATSIYLLLLFQLRILEPPRRYYSFSGFDAFKEADEISRKVIIVFVCIQFIFVFNIINSFVNSKKR
jgi:heme/copper-type cytochrome/quinol oxidase subunit 1